jgi:hypothetical protein
MSNRRTGAAHLAKVDAHRHAQPASDDGSDAAVRSDAVIESGARQ